MANKHYELIARLKLDGSERSVILPSEHEANVALVAATRALPFAILRETEFRIEATDAPVSRF